MYTIEKFLLHLNQGAPPREGFLPPQEGRNPSRGHCHHLADRKAAAAAGGLQSYQAPSSYSILQYHQPPHTSHDTVCTL